MRGASAKRQFQIEMMNIDCVNGAGTPDCLPIFS
jgi:hypothetical protein